ncbi:nucleolar protein 58-like [Palaemon carinicauda]|uniref:nucleolar protein 58-like n=1 Tax=Palaemon carinicauda TaxID=392227 RepID=UPI0035B67C9A
MASITKERNSHKERVSHLSSSKEMSEERIVQFTKENVGLKDELLVANEIIPLLKEELEGGDKKKENRPGIRKVRLNKTSLEISTEMDVKDGQKEDVQKDVRDNKSEEKVVEAEDQDANGRKAEKGALRDINNRQEEQKLQKETSRDEEKEEEEKKKEEKIAKRTTRKPIVFDLEPEKPKRVISSSDNSHITFQGEKEKIKTAGFNTKLFIFGDMNTRFGASIRNLITCIDVPGVHGCTYTIINDPVVVPIDNAFAISAVCVELS